MARVTSALLASALVRRAAQEGGSAALLARGDAIAGGILLLLYERGANPRFVERGVGPAGESALLASGPAAFADEQAVTGYWKKRRSHDADLWVIELDIAQAERFAAETMGFH